MLTSRQRAILRNFLENDMPIHIKDMASTFCVSSRTIKYDLDAIRKCLEEIGVELKSNSKMGVWLDKDLSIRNKLYNLLEESDNPQLSIYDQNERTKAIMLDLLVETKFIKVSDWEKKFMVSRKTIQSDLSLVESLLAEWGVKLFRGNKGIRVLATEKQKRLSLEHVLQNGFQPQEMFWILKAISRGYAESNVLNRYRYLLKLNIDFNYIFKAIANFTRMVNKQLGICLSDRVILSLFIRIAITLQRVSRGCFIENVFYKEKSLYDQGVFTLFKKMIEQLSISVGLQLTENEMLYAGLPLISESLNKIDGLQSVDPYKLAEKLVFELSRASQIPFNQDPDLINLLFIHLSDKLTKIKQGIVEPNPLINEITHNYHELFKLVEEVYLKVIYPKGIIFTESDIGYIVLHFQASIERLKNSWKYKALVVCSTGRGMARLLKNKLESDMKDLIVVGTCSILEIEKMVAFMDVDVVISMLPVKCSIPVIQVNAIPTDKDLKDIRDILNTIPKSSNRTNINTAIHVQSNLEAFTQEIIMKGLELARIITNQFKQYLPNDRSEGLSQHILFMINRLTFNNAYSSSDKKPRIVGKVENEIRQALRKTVLDWGINLPEEEVDAIMAYFIWEEKGEKDINVGS